MDVRQMKFKGHIINGGKAEGEAIVLDVPFSLIGDFDPNTGRILIKGHRLEGENLAGKVLICPTGKGGTIAPFVAYEAKSMGNAPAAIICKKAEPIIALSAITIDIPMIDKPDKNPLEVIKTGDYVEVDGDRGVIEVKSKRLSEAVQK
jgi:predicted aconitase with swiveling domain